MVILLKDPSLGADRGRAQQILKDLCQIGGLREMLRFPCLDFLYVCGSFLGILIDRGLLTQYQGGDIRYNPSPFPYPHVPVPCHPTYGHSVEIPFGKYILHLFLFTLLGHKQHPLLGFGEHYLIRDHTRFSRRDQTEIDIHTCPTLSGHFAI